MVLWLQAELVLFPRAASWTQPLQGCWDSMRWLPRVGPIASGQPWADRRCPFRTSNCPHVCPGLTVLLR
jgi:hypothetical protein